MNRVIQIYQSAHYISLHETGKFGGGTTHRCPGVFQIECGDKPVDNVGFFVRTKKGDVVIGAPSGRVRIYGKTVDIVASGSDSKTGNVNIVSTNKTTVNAKKLDLIGTAGATLSSSANVYVTASNILYLSGAFVKGGTGGILGGLGGLPRILTNNGPSELIQTIQKLFDIAS